MKPLRGGLKLDAKKESTLTPWSAARAPLPGRVRISLSEPASSAAEPLVRVGDRVRVGEKIAEGPQGKYPAFHASISGTVSRISRFPHPLLGEARAIEIRSDGKDEGVPGTGVERPGWESLIALDLVRILREAGAIDLTQDASPPVSIHTVILNGCESEPYLTSDHSLMMTHPAEILKAGEILRRAVGAEDLIVALEENKEEIAELLRSKIFFHTGSKARVEVLPSRYPQGENRALIRTLLGCSLGPGQSPREAGVTVVGMAEAYAAYEAVALQKPFYERIVTISGECVAQPRNFWLRIGTLVEDAVKLARGFLREPGRVVHGGPMKGVALGTLEVPVLKVTPGILGLPREIVQPGAVEPCIRCGRCVESCPEFLSPVMITLAAEKELWDVAEEYGARLCIECGNCSYVCPSKRPMVELIQSANAR